jgi:uncharacterized protein (DUF58 family)
MHPRHLRWRLVRRMPGVAQGEFLSLSRGTGFDLVNLSPYQAGDDVRLIDWHASARSGELQVRHLQEDRDLTCWIIADLSASQDAGLGHDSKRSLLLSSVSVIVGSLAQHGNRLGLWIDDGNAQSAVILPPRAGRAQTLRLLSRLQAHKAPIPAQTSDLLRLFTQLSSALKRRSLVIMLSDFLSQQQAPADWRPRLAALAARHDLVLLHLEDPSEWQLPEAGSFVVQDAETGEQLWVDGDDTTFRERYAAALEAERESVHQALQGSGARWLTLQTGQDPLRTIANWLRRQSRRRIA